MRRVSRIGSLFFFFFMGSAKMDWFHFAWINLFLDTYSNIDVYFEKDVRDVLLLLRIYLSLANMKYNLLIIHSLFCS